LYENFYLKELYPLQDSILNLINTLETNFYLTGGTALSRCYLNHRYSDDLDFFVNDNSSFSEEALRIQEELHNNFDIEIQRVSERFRRLFIHHKTCNLKIEFINDVPAYFGELQTWKNFNTVDNPLNILSNKITAVMDRDEVKDFADIFAIAYYMGEIDWREMFVSASSKSAGIFAPLFAERLANFDFNRLEQIKWYKEYDWRLLDNKRNEILESIVGLI